MNLTGCADLLTTLTFASGGFLAVISDQLPHRPAAPPPLVVRAGAVSKYIVGYLGLCGKICGF